MTYNTVAQAEQWAINHPTKTVGAGGPSWSGWCAALMFWAGNFDTSCDTAEEGSYASGIISSNASQAPRGAFHWWRMGSEGHVALDLDGGGTRLLMGSSSVSNLGSAIGTISWAAYGGSEYAGWSLDFVGQKMADVGQPGSGTTPPVDAAAGITIQKVAQRGGYTGPLDGVPGRNTWIGVQTLVRGYGYNGPIDGNPGTNTFMGLQNLAKLGGYSGAVDGVLNSGTYAGLTAWLAAAPPAPTGPSGVYGVDAATTQRDVNFNTLRDAGYQFAIIKAGGTNVSPMYVAPFYQQQVAAARSAGLLVGHYWVAGSMDAQSDANFFVDHLFDYRDGDILALDNEKIDDGIFWDDTRTALFMQTVKTRLGRAPFLYTYSSLLTSIAWPKTRAVGSKLWVAHFTSAGSPAIGSSFPEWSIHQFTSSGSVNGVPIDVNLATLGAFAGLSQPQFGATAPPPGAIGGGTSTPPVSSTTNQGIILQQLAQRGGYTGPLDGDPGSNTWKGVQQQLRNLGYYSGPVDGLPGTNTYKGLQLLARAYGYTGPIDGVPGPNTYTGIQTYLNSSGGAASGSDGETIQRISQAGGYTGVIDGDPGANTWKGMQQVLFGYGYSGPVDGEMGSNSNKAFQRFAAKGGYSGVVDGALGVNSWKGIQTMLKGFGYTGPIDGAPGTNTYIGLQQIARLGGYNGPLDGVPGVNTWKGLQAFLSGTGYTGPIDGAPGTNTYRAMQTLASRGGYTGPIDGEPGPRTYAGLASLLEGGNTGPTEYPSVPAPTAPAALNNGAFYSTVAWIEKIAGDYRSAHSGSPSVAELVAQFMRRNDYTGVNWVLLAGPFATGWVTYAKSRIAAANFPLVETYYLPEFGAKPQSSAHLFASLNAHLYRPFPANKTRIGLVDVASWAGDLVTTLRDFANKRNPLTQTITSFGDKYLGALGDERNVDFYSFGRLDLIQDVDAYNIAVARKASVSVSLSGLVVTALTGSWSGAENRYATFMRLRFGNYSDARLAAGQVFLNTGSTPDELLFNVARTNLLGAAGAASTDGDGTSINDYTANQLQELGNCFANKIRALS